MLTLPEAQKFPVEACHQVLIELRNKNGKVLSKRMGNMILRNMTRTPFTFLISIQWQLFQHFSMTCSPFHLPSLFQLDRASLLAQLPSSAVSAFSDLHVEQVWQLIKQMIKKAVSDSRYCFVLNVKESIEKEDDVVVQIVENASEFRRTPVLTLEMTTSPWEVIKEDVILHWEKTKAEHRFLRSQLGLVHSIITEQAPFLHLLTLSSRQPISYSTIKESPHGNKEYNTSQQKEATWATFCHRIYGDGSKTSIDRQEDPPPTSTSSNTIESAFCEEYFSKTIPVHVLSDTKDLLQGNMALADLPEANNLTFTFYTKQTPLPEGAWSHPPNSHHSASSALPYKKEYVLVIKDDSSLFYQFTSSEKYPFQPTTASDSSFMKSYDESICLHSPYAPQHPLLENVPLECQQEAVVDWICQELFSGALKEKQRYKVLLCFHNPGNESLCEKLEKESLSKFLNATEHDISDEHFRVPQECQILFCEIFPTLLEHIYSSPSPTPVTSSLKKTKTRMLEDFYLSDPYIIKRKDEPAILNKTNSVFIEEKQEAPYFSKSRWRHYMEKDDVEGYGHDYEVFQAYRKSSQAKEWIQRLEGTMQIVTSSLCAKDPLGNTKTSMIPMSSIQRSCRVLLQIAMKEESREKIKQEIEKKFLLLQEEIAHERERLKNTLDLIKKKRPGLLMTLSKDGLFRGDFYSKKQSGRVRLQWE